RPLLADPAVLKVGQNLKYDMVVLRQHGIELLAPFDDTMLLSYALDAGRGHHGMDELSAKHLGHTPISFKMVTGGVASAKADFSQVPLRAATDYAAEDADVTLRLHTVFKDRLWREQVTRIYEQVDRPLLPVVASMEIAGIRVDRAALAGLSAAYEIEIARLEGEIHEAAGGPFTIGSPKQLGEVLFERMKLPSGRKSSKTGAWATDVTELERLAESGIEVAAKVLEWRQLSKLKSTYTDALQAQINPKTDRVH
ncbi:DNA polymerase, partial [Polymorphobacter multimanifer]